jgi:hypothetical protein
MRNTTRTYTDMAMQIKGSKNLSASEFEFSPYRAVLGFRDAIARYRVAITTGRCTVTTQQRIIIMGQRHDNRDKENADD